ncbi:MAG: amidase family protein, partial [Pseudomonadota bacterium]
MMKQLQFDIPSLHAAYADGLSPEAVVAEVFRRIDEVGDPGIFICLEEQDRIAEFVTGLGSFDSSRLPLWGVPFAVKDNIDAAGLSTTAACPAFAYRPHEDAFCLARLREAGAILIGKTNLDQFATGLVGVRTPYPVPKNAVDPTLVPGGSSSGSAVAVAHGIVSFALGTDTAGSGRVPAGLNNIVGLKPSLGSVSNTGVVPACRTLDTISVFALNVGDANSVHQQISCFDAADPYARRTPVRSIGPVPTTFRVGVPDKKTRQFCGDTMQAHSFESALNSLADLGAEFIPINFEPFYEVADLLYSGAWVAERDTVL